MKTKLSLMAAAVMAVIGTNASAELYVSPIVEDSSSISIVNDAPVPAAQSRVVRPYVAPVAPAKALTAPTPAPAQAAVVAAPAATPALSTPSPVSTAAPIVVTRAASLETPKAEVKKTQGLFGRSVPLKIAANNLTPNKSWIVNIENGLDTKLVSWSNASNYEDAFGQIERSSGIHITINKAESSIGIAFTDKMANNLAKRSPNIYVINPNLSLRKNLEAWAAKANWTVVYDNGLSADYDGMNSATLTVPFEGPGGAADLLLKGTWDKTVPLMGRFKTGNRTLFVQERGFDRVNKLESEIQ
ncbi:hypothetical protein ACI2KR_07065 [Pseudomonas luteola]